MVVLVAVACREPSEPPAVAPPPVPATTPLPIAPFVPLISGGEVVLGVGGEIVVSAAPAGATIELYQGTRQGDGPCALDHPDSPCAGITDPVLVASEVADPAGAAVFALPGDAPEPTAVVWQAKVVDPVDARMVAYTDAVVRHAALRPQDATVTFDEVTMQAGLVDTFTVGNTHTGGVGFVDVNGDYLPDLLIVSGAGVRNRLYLNLGDGQFVEESWRMQKPAPEIESAGVAFADLENDGDLDVVVPVDNPQQMISSVAQPYEGGPNLLFVNDGTGTFTETAEAAGVLDPRGWRNSNAAFADFDLDGCIDLYLLQWAMAAPPGGDNRDRLLRGLCDGTFDDVTEAFGIDPEGRDGLGVFWFDAGNDLYPDLYVANNADRDERPIFDPMHDFWKNQGGTGFENWTTRGHPSTGMDGWAGMGMDAGDIDADGDWDLYITDVWQLPPVPKGNVLYFGAPDGSLSANACQETNLCFGYNSWPTNFVDFDNDGWVDLWVGASVAGDPSLLYVNRGEGDGVFDPVRVEGWSGKIVRGGTAADYDADGDVDVFFWLEGADSELWTNTLGESAGWIQLRLLGTRSNRAAIGARVEITSELGHRVTGEVGGGDSAHSQTDLVVHLGLGNAETAHEVKVFWPSGEVQQFDDVAIDRFWLVDEDAGLVDEALVDPAATWDPALATLTVSTASTYRGRSGVFADTLGPLDYDVTTVSYSASFPLAARPDEVALRTSNGLIAAVPVTDAPQP